MYSRGAMISIYGRVDKKKRDVVTYIQCDELGADLPSVEELIVKKMQLPREVLAGDEGNKMLKTMIERNQQMVDLTLRQQQSDSGAAPPNEILNLEEALEAMKQLNPHCQDDRVLRKVLEAHVRNEKLELSGEEMALAGGGQQLLLPIAAPEPQEMGFQVSHCFVLKEGGRERECRSVKLIESPEILAVHNLMREEECQALLEMIGELKFEAAKVTYMKLKTDGQLMQFAVPNDGYDVNISITESNSSLRRQCEVALLERDSLLFKLFRAKAAAVCRASPELIQTIAVERYLKQTGAETGGRLKQGHFSNQRQGAVVFALTSAPDGGYVFPQIGINLSPLRGMAMYVPACYPETLPGGADAQSPSIPDLRTEFEVEPSTAHDLVFVTVYVDLPLVEEEKTPSVVSEDEHC